MKKFAVQQYELNKRKSGLGRGTLRFAFLTDLHNVTVGPDNRDLLAAVGEAKPDAVLCGGDMIVGKPGSPVEPARTLMLQLAERYPVYCATGNHEYRTKIYPETYPGMYEAYQKPLQKAGVIFLENKKAVFKKEDLTAVIYGYDMERRYYDRFRRRKLPVEAVNQALGRPDPEIVTMLLAHNPAQMDTYFRWGADVTLCGHYHGGVVRLGEHRGLVSPDFRLFPGDVHGLFRRGGKSVIVSAGLGEHTLPLRICNPRELVVLDIKVS